MYLISLFILFQDSYYPSVILAFGSLSLNMTPSDAQKVHADQTLPHTGIHLLTFAVASTPPPHAFNQLMVQKAQDESDGMPKDLK